MAAIEPINSNDVVARIAHVCTLLEADAYSYLIAEVGEVEDLDPQASARDTDAVLHAIGGMRCGNVYVAAEPYPDGEVIYDLLDGGPERWKVIGEIEAVPFAADRRDGSIWHALRASGESYDTQPQRIAPDVWTFIAWYVLGPGYVDITPETATADTNSWLAFLQDNGLLVSEPANTERHPATAYLDERRAACGARGLLASRPNAAPMPPG